MFFRLLEGFAANFLRKVFQIIVNYMASQEIFFHVSYKEILNFKWIINSLKMC